jgi:succinyl-CoA synthetase beta subunit
MLVIKQNFFLAYATELYVSIALRRADEVCQKAGFHVECQKQISEIILKLAFLFHEKDDMSSQIPSH